jgi:hypothetical protein
MKSRLTVIAASHEYVPQWCIALDQERHMSGLLADLQATPRERLSDL